MSSKKTEDLSDYKDFGLFFVELYTLRNLDLRNYERSFGMDSTTKWLLTDEEKDKFIATLTPILTVLRTRAEISQEELANLIGVSRQTYSAIERKVRKMAWSTYLSLVLFYDHNQKTHKMIRQLSIFPKELIIRFNDGVDYSDYEISSFLGKKSSEIIEDLDEQAKGAIRAVVMMEYTRCKSISNDEVIKTLSGIAK